MRELWEMQGTHSLLSLPGSLCSAVVARYGVLSMGLKNFLTFKLRAKNMTNAEINFFK